MKRILCIDDSFTRYSEFYKQACALGYEVMISDDPSFVGLLLDLHRSEIVGICLDHDMTCGRDGTWFANEYLIQRNIPVAIVSLNPGGANNIAKLFDEYNVEYIITPAGGKSFIHSVMKFFEQK